MRTLLNPAEKLLSAQPLTPLTGSNGLTMRVSRQNVASLCRCFHSSAGAPSPRLQVPRYLRQSTSTQVPRQRSFVTSGMLKSQGASESAISTKGSQAEPETRNTESTAAATKRKTTRSTGAKNSLRRVAIIAQQPGGRAPGAATGAPAEAEVGGATSMSAICVAESFNMEMVKDILQAHGFEIDPDGTGFEAAEVVHARGVSNGDIFVFPSGTVVTWSLPPDVVTRLATRQLLRAAIDPHVRQAELEDLEYVSDSGRDTSAMKGDVVVLGTKRQEQDGDKLDTTLAKVAFSSGLARSTKLAVLESSLTAYLEETKRIPTQLSKGSGMALSRKFILQKTGELLSLRAQLNHYWELTDSLPDIFWDQSSELGLEGYYDQVGKALDVNVRIKALNQKMDYAQEIATVLREMSSEKHSTRLEWIIIILIAVEVLFELRRVYNDYMETHEKKHVEETAKLNYDDLS